METMAMALFVKPLVETFVKNYVAPALANVFKNIKGECQKDLIKSSEAFEAYYEHSYERYSIINTLAFKERVKKLKDIYIPLSLCLSENSRDKKAIQINAYPKDLLDKYQRVLITDTAGMGKSTLMKRMFLDVIDNKHGIPFFVELRRISSTNDILNEISVQLGGLDNKFDSDLLTRLFREGGNIFFFDGYDEIPSQQKSFVTSNIQEFVSKVPDNKFILTSRPEEELAGLGNFQEFRIKELKKEESYELLRKYDNQGNISKLLINKLKSGNYTMISDFLKNPLLVTLLFVAFDYKQTIPVKKHIFYRQVFDAYFDSHDLSKGDGYVHEKKSKLDIDDFDKVMRRIGFECLRRQQIEFTKDELLNIVDTARANFPSLSFTSMGLLSDLLKAVPLFCQDGVYYKWVHKSLQEYFAAEFIYKDSKSNQDAILSKLYNSKKIDSYINLLDLYFDIDPNGFQKNIVKPFLEAFVDYYEQNYISGSSLPYEEVCWRLTMTFGNRIVAGRIEMGDDKPSSYFDDIYNICHEKIGEFPTSSTIMRTGSFVARVRNNHYRVMLLLERRIPKIFSKIEWKAKKGSLVLSKKAYEIKGMENFAKSKGLFVKLNMLLSSRSDNFYIDVNTAKGYLQSINLMIEQSCNSNDLLSGL